MDLYDAGIGDTITLPNHHPATVTLTGWHHSFGTSAWTQGATAGDLAQFAWTADGGWHGTTSMSEATPIILVRKAAPDDPVRRQYEADLEATLAVLLASDQASQ